MSLALSEHERQAFLAGVHVGVISMERADGPSLTVPIWYGYEPGGLVWIITNAGGGGLKFSMRPTRWWSVDYAKGRPRSLSPSPPSPCRRPSVHWTASSTSPHPAGP
jgi:hypothetical protein